jgi:hypothetical protein
MNKFISLSVKLLLAALAVFLCMGANCVTTGNVMVVEYIDDFDAQTESNLDFEEVDLTTNDDWNDNKEDIAGIDDIGFACRIENLATEPAGGQLFLYKPKNPADQLTTYEDVVEQGTLLLSGIVVAPGATREILWDESYDFLQNFDAAKEIVFSEKFQVYFIADETPFSIHVTDIVLFLSISGKP